jgi:ParB family chromosome partitioning protein
MNKRGLGRGLDALLAVGHEVDRGENLTLVPVGEIAPNPYQPRRDFDENRLSELADSIKMYGVLQPIVVRRYNDGYQLVTGERRWRASKIAGLRVVPAVVRDYSDTEMTAVALVENLQRENLNPIEEAIAYRRLIDEFGFTQEEVSQKVGKSRSFIANTVRLLNLPTAVQEYVSRGTMTPGQARPLLVLPTPQMQMEAAGEVVNRALTARGAEELARNWNAKKTKQPIRSGRATPNENEVREFSERLSRILGAKVQVVEREGGGGTITIDCFSEEELHGLIELLERIGTTVPSDPVRGNSTPFSV